MEKNSFQSEQKSTQRQKQPNDPKYYQSFSHGEIMDQFISYRLTTMWQTKQKSLDIINDGQNNRLRLAKTGDYSGQKWNIISVLDAPGWYNLTTEFTPNKFLSLINKDQENNQLRMQSPNKKAQQSWKFIKIEGQNDYYRISCMQQSTKSIDIRNDGINDHPWLSKTGNYSGQFWKIQKYSLI